VSIGAACAIGIAGAVAWGAWLLALVAAGAFLVLAYNLELAGGRFHTDLWFGLAWGGFPVLAGYAVVAGEIGVAAVVAAAFATVLSLVQRALSTHVRHVRRRVVSAEGTFELADGTREPLDPSRLIVAEERALRLLTLATVLLAIALVAARL
jgi:hypothetical protein